MLLARKLDAQTQKYNKTIPKIFMEENPLLLPKFETPKETTAFFVSIAGSHRNSF